MTTYQFKFFTKEERDKAYGESLDKENNIIYLGDYFRLYNFDVTGEYLLDLYFDEEDLRVYKTAIPCPEEKKDETLKKILKYTAIGFIGIIIGRKTCRYKTWKGHHDIFIDPRESDDWRRGANWALYNINQMMRDNHLVYVIDKKRRK